VKIQFFNVASVPFCAKQIVHSTVSVEDIALPKYTTKL